MFLYIFLCSIRIQKNMILNASTVEVWDGEDEEYGNSEVCWTIELDTHNREYYLWNLFQEVKIY